MFLCFLIIIAYRAIFSSLDMTASMSGLPFVSYWYYVYSCVCQVKKKINTDIKFPSQQTIYVFHNLKQ